MKKVKILIITLVSILIVGCITFAILYYIHLFKKYIKNINKISAVIFSCLAISFPFYIYIYIFQLVSLPCAINILISAIALHLFYNFIY